MNIISRPYDAGLYVGRFQHIHKGHEATIEQALMVCDRLLILVGSAQEQGTIRNPWDVSLRINMIKEVYPHDNVIVHALSDYSEPGDITAAWGNHVLSAVKQHLRKTPDIMIYGKEDSNMNWFAHQPNEVRNITEMIIARDRYSMSATQMREWLFWDNFDLWKEHANPKLHKHYDLLRRELLSAPGMKDLVRIHLSKPLETWNDRPTIQFK